ncbi:MAG: DEAD/DEAH box helicase [Akkermansiaceae bacterium]|nr:DEAD/DEAH box helicase [Akkermansiaceae bacterium]
MHLILDGWHIPEKGLVSYEVDASCDCGEMDCVHPAVVLERLLDIAVTCPQPPSREMDPKLAAWLRSIRDAAGVAAGPPEPPKLYSKFLAYCLEPIGVHYLPLAKRPLGLVLRQGNHLKSGISIDRNQVHPKIHKPFKYMTPEDMGICWAIANRSVTGGHWTHEMPLEGNQWEHILIPALKEGRLFLGKFEEHGSSPQKHIRLASGPPIPLALGWQAHRSGSLKPVLKPGNPDVLILPTRPLYYLDEKEGLLGSFESPLPQALLSAWREGPEVSGDSLPDLAPALEALPLPEPLPTPAVVPPRELKGLKPVPCLRVAQFTTGVFLQRHIGAALSFDYPGCPRQFPLPPKGKPEVAWMDGDTRVILRRNQRTETHALSLLNDIGLTPIESVVPAIDIPAKSCHSFVLGSTKVTTAEWMELIASAGWQRLIDEGWRIEIDPKLGLTIHEASDFFPVIESETDHGIEWFRFDLSAEFDGKRMSLIPQLARAIEEDWHLRYQEPATQPETLLLPCDNPADGFLRFPAKRFLEILANVRHLFHGEPGQGPLRLDRLGAAGVADGLSLDTSATTRALAALGENLRNLHGLPETKVPAAVKAKLRPYQIEGFRWLQFLAANSLHGILADDMGLGKTLQTIVHLVVEHARKPGRPSLVIAPTSVVPNWSAEFARFAPRLKVLVLHGSDRAPLYKKIPRAQVVLTSYPLLIRDFEILEKQAWHVLALDEAQYIKNPKASTAVYACELSAAHRICLTGTPLQNHLGELWSLMRFLMPGLLGHEKTFATRFRRPIERERSADAQHALNRRVAPLILRRTKDAVAAELPEKTLIVHGIDLTPAQTDLYESVRAAMDKRVREAISTKGLAQSHIIVLAALLKLRQICCHPLLLKQTAPTPPPESAKLTYLTDELLPTLIEEGRRILLFSQFTSMLEIIERHLVEAKIPFLKLTGQTKERGKLVESFQNGDYPVFLISLKAGGTGLNLTGADAVIHYDPWWNPAAEDQATDRAHRIGQNKPVFVHKLVCRGTIEERIQELQRHKAGLVEALLTDATAGLRIDPETLSHLLAPLA